MCSDSCNKKYFLSDSHDDNDLFARNSQALSLFLAIVFLMLLSSSLFKLLFIPLYPETEMKILRLRSCLTDPIRMESKEKATAKEKILKEKCCLIFFGHIWSFSSNPCHSINNMSGRIILDPITLRLLILDFYSF